MFLLHLWVYSFSYFVLILFDIILSLSNVTSLQHNEEAKTVREVEAHEKRIRKELEKQDLLNRKVFLSCTKKVHAYLS
jgi:hypothetical protein